MDKAINYIREQTIQQWKKPQATSNQAQQYRNRNSHSTNDEEDDDENESSVFNPEDDFI